MSPRDPVDIAKANGTLARLAFHLQQLGDSQDHALSEEQANAVAERIIADYGHTSGAERAVDILSPRIEPAAADTFTKLASGPFPSGRRVEGQDRKLRTADLIVSPRTRAADARLVAEAAVRAAGRTLKRKVKKALTDHAGDRQAQAHALVSLGLSLAKAGQAMGGIEKQSVANLLERRANRRGLTVPAETDTKGVEPQTANPKVR